MKLDSIHLQLQNDMLHVDWIEIQTELQQFQDLMLVLNYYRLHEQF